MTTIAWDGKTLAADKQGDYSGLRLTVSKLHRVGNLLCAGSGDIPVIVEMLDWVKRGRVASEFPSAQREEKTCCAFLVIEDGRARLYSGSHIPTDLEMPFMAIGSGREFAMAAMYVGKSAREAVLVASALDTGSGNGIDVLEA